FVAAVVPPRVDTHVVRVQLSEHDVDIDELPPPKNWVDQRIRERLGVIKKLDPKEVSARARSLLVSNTPKVMAVLLPLFALLLMMFFWGHFYVEHLVFALHVHAFAFFSGALAELTRSDTVENLVWLGVLVWTFIALRAVYRQSWLRTTWKMLLLSIVYGIFVGLGVTAALLGGLFLG
ncbi:MAG TPA: hypothetical protein VF945_17310, partial [Polyangia bacterium]